jgi:hypothetical protein
VEGTFVNVCRSGDGPYACPCCGYLTLDERGMYEICPVCFWEDDGQDDHDADRVRGGPNRGLSLSMARDNFARIGASEPRRLPLVRAPRSDEHPPDGHGEPGANPGFRL